MSPDPSQSAFDELLVLAWKSGSRRAADRLAQRWHRRLWTHARVLTGSSDDASDAVQSAWADIARGRSGLRDPACFGAWAYRIVTRRCADLIRQKARRRAREPRAQAAPPDAIESRAEAPSDHTDLHAAMRSLSPEDHALLRLVHVDGLALRHAASVFGLPVGTVKSRLHHARAAVREALANAEPEGDER